MDPRGKPEDDDVVSPAADQFVERVDALERATREIEDGEREMNELLYGLYRLTQEERLLVENDPARRAAV